MRLGNLPRIWGIRNLMKRDEWMTATEIQGRIIEIEAYQIVSDSQGVKRLLDKLIHDFIRYSSKLRNPQRKKARLILQAIEGFREKEV